MSKTFDKEKLRRALSDEGCFENSVYEAFLELKKKLEVEDPPANAYLISINGRLCQVIVPANVSIQEAVKAIQDAKKASAADKVQELLERLSALPNFLNEHSQPANKPKKHDWYKQFDRNKYGRK